MAFITPVQLVDTNGIHNIIYLTQDIPSNCITLTDDALSRQEQQAILTNNNQTINIGSLPLIDDLTLRSDNETAASLIDNFNFLEDKDPVNNTSLQLDATLSQTPILFSYVPQTSSQSSKTDPRDSLDYVINNFQATESNSILTPVNTVQTQNDVNISPSCMTNTNFDVDLLLSLNDFENVGKKCEEINGTNKIIDNSMPNFFIRTDIDPKKCNYCNETYLTEDMVKSHIENVHSVINTMHTCNICQKNFNSLENVVMHSTDHWKYREKCPIGGFPTCNRSYVKNLLLAHLRKQHIEENPNNIQNNINNELHSDITATQLFPNDINNVNITFNELNNQQCQNENLNAGKIVNDNVTNNVLTPSVTGSKPSEAKTLSDASLSRWAGRPRKDGTSLYVLKKWKNCGHCEKKYLTHNTLRKHIQIAHPQIYADMLCKICRKPFDYKEKLILHAADHWKPREKCPIGGFSSCTKFPSKPILRAHICRFHIEGTNNERPYACKECKSSFDKPSQLTRHIRVHTKEKPFECNECHAKFSQKNSLVVHRVIHTKQNPHKCPCCPSSFSQFYNCFKHIFHIHYKHHEAKGSVQCEKCSNSFPDHQKALQHYLKVHKDLATSYLTRNIQRSPAPLSKKKHQPIILKHIQSSNSKAKKKNTSLLKQNIQTCQNETCNLVPTIPVNLNNNDRLLQEPEMDTSKLKPVLQTKSDYLVQPISSEINEILSEIGITLENNSMNNTDNISLPSNYQLQEINSQNIADNSPFLGMEIILSLNNKQF